MLAIIVGKTLYIAGKGDYKPKEDTAGKVKNCLGEVRKVLKMAGMDMNNVVQTYIYLEDHDQYAVVDNHSAEFFPGDPPSRTTLCVAQVPGDSRLEITCVAYGDLSEKSGSATRHRICRSVQGFWPAIHSIFRARETSLAAAAILRPLKNRCGRRCATSRRRSSRLALISGMSS